MQLQNLDSESHYVDIVGVTGSIPVAPTMTLKYLPSRLTSPPDIPEAYRKHRMRIRGLADCSILLGLPGASTANLGLGGSLRPNSCQLRAQMREACDLELLHSGLNIGTRGTVLRARERPLYGLD